MVQYMMRVGMAAGFFLFLNVWERVRARRSHDAYVNEMENGPATPLDQVRFELPAAYLVFGVPCLAMGLTLCTALRNFLQLVNAARQKAAASPLLNVKNFSLENLEVRKLQRSSSSSLFANSQRADNTPDD